MPRFPYPFVPPPPQEVETWDDYFVWAVAKYCARDNFSRVWRKWGIPLPPVDETRWDRPIPLPRTAAPRPKAPNFKKFKIPDAYFFEHCALPPAEQEEYEAMLYK